MLFFLRITASILFSVFLDPQEVYAKQVSSATPLVSWEQVFTALKTHAPWILSSHDDFAKDLKQAYQDRVLASPSETSEKIQAQVFDDVLRMASDDRARFFNPGQQEYLALASKFSGSVTKEPYFQSGAWFTRRGKRWFVAMVFAQTPAEKNGLSRGDEIVSVDGEEFDPVGAFIEGKKRVLEIRRSPIEKPVTIEITPVLRSVQEMLLASMLASQKLIERKDRKLGYFWLTAASHESFKKAWFEACRDFQHSADLLILDLRGGFAGADLSYFEPLVGDHAVFRKKVIVLVDQETQSGRKSLARLIQKTGRGSIVGSVNVKGEDPMQVQLLDHPHGVLYFPTSSSYRNYPLIPDVEVDAPLVYAHGADPVLMSALELSDRMESASRP